MIIEEEDPDFTIAVVYFKDWIKLIFFINFNKLKYWNL